MSQFISICSPKKLRSGCLLLCAFLAISARGQTSSSSAAPVSPARFGALPLFFETDAAQNRFLARGHNYQFQLSPTEARIVLARDDGSASAAPLDRHELLVPRQLLTRMVRMRFMGANPQGTITGDSEIPGKVNYLIGNDPAQWRAGVSTWSKVRIGDLYPGVSLVYYGNQQQLEYDFTIAPRADPRSIAIRFEGADKLEITARGELVLSLGAEQIRQPAPVVYQIAQGRRREIAGGYRLKDAATVEFAIGPYDPALPLIIDPVLSYATYFGGNYGDMALAVKVDQSGSVYLAGETLSTQFPFAIPPGGVTTSFQGGRINGDAFVAKLDNQASALIYFTYLGGSGNDGALDLAIDAAGNAYLAGFTDSPNFPRVNALYPTISGTIDPVLHVYPTDGFVAELNTNGSALVYSTYLGGTAMDVADAIAVDPAGNAYVTGYTFSSNFPVTSATAFQTSLQGGSDLFFTKLAANGTAVGYSTYLGGTNTDEGQGIAVDAAGFAYLTGYTASTNFPVTADALQPQINRSTNAAVTFRGRAIPLDAFLLKFDATASGAASLVYSTLFGGTNSDAGYRITLDSSANAYVTGNSSSPDFTNTATNVPDLHVGANGTNVLNTDAFLTKFSFGSNGAAIVYSALFGGKTNDVGWDVAVDAAGNAFVAGVTWSHDFPTNNPPQFLSITNRGNADAFVTAFNTNASALLYSAYLGGSGDDFGYGIAVDPSGNAYVVGRTLSANFALTNASLFQASRDGTNDAFIAKILLQPLLVASPAGGNIELKWRAFAPEFFLETNPGQTGASNWTFASPAPPAANGWHTITLPATNGSSRFRLKR